MAKTPRQLDLSDPQFTANLRGHDMQFETTWGLFSPREIDAGTALLLEEIELHGDENILDIGCGYGPIGLTLAKDTNGEVHLVDKDFVAIEYAAQNAQLNKIKNAKAYLSNGLSELPKGMQFDVIVSNIPAKVGRELLQIFLNDIEKRLSPNGHIYFVTIAGLKDFMKNNLKKQFGHYKKLAQKKGYAIHLCQPSLAESIPDEQS